MNLVMHRVDSTSIELAGYDDMKQILAVKFHNGLMYHYLNVPQYVYNEFLNSPSLGTYINTHIKPQYEFVKIEPD